jgi:hypothetical protein
MKPFQPLRAYWLTAAERRDSGPVTVTVRRVVVDVIDGVATPTGEIIERVVVV